MHPSLLERYQVPCDLGIRIRVSLNVGMVNFKDPAVISHDSLAVVKIWHTILGLFIWEFITNLDYEWSVIRGHRPYRWTIWLYSLTRMTALVGLTTNVLGADASRPINCQLWITFTLIFAYTAVATASLLIAIRVIAIWNRNKIVYAIAIAAWVANVSCMLRAIVEVRGEWSPTSRTCEVSHSTSVKLNIIVTFFTDIVLLLIMLVRLLRWRFGEGGGSRLSRFLETQVGLLESLP
ncbi:hypothetical protein BC827DRAFT_923099 [Russula dissimulans]|nr:hypothetical protein BC827DRAFT_923099 [Russula dissimulans]